jgi:Holliday junction resolvase RusA-like endonuclease
VIDLTPKAERGIEFTIPGAPNQKRSVVARAIKTRTSDGREFWKGVASKSSKNAPVENNIQQWVINAGWDIETPPHTGPVCLCVKAFFKPNTGVPKFQIPMYETEQILHTKKPDLDRLQNMIQDALTGMVWQDDSQVALYAKGSGKWYSYRERTEVKIWLLKEQLPRTHAEYKELAKFTAQ